ncbi:MAG: PKD domain-containing protein [Deltaproteobacteria bacterium]|nr:PKD domain-containing protein [Deltaproteobacteria bacterium]
MSNTSARMRFPVGAVLFVCALASSPAGAEKAVDVSAIQRAIVEAGAQWTAGPTPLTEMTREELDLMFPEVEPLDGIPVEPADEPLPPPLPPDPDPSLSRFSWSDYDGENWLTDVGDQGMCGACVAFSTLAAMEGQYNIVIGDPWVDLDLCEQQLVSCTSMGCDGGRIDDALDYLRSTGVPDDACYPYTASETACGLRCSDWASRTLRISSWGWSDTSTGAIKDLLVRGPLVASMDVYGDFLAYTGGVYTHVTGAEEGSHAVTIVGWDDAHSSWICKNSWGTSWGDGGYFEIRRSEGCLDRRKAYMTVSTSIIPGHPCLDPHRQDVEVMSGGELVSVTATMTNCGGRMLDWTASPDPGTGWFSVVPVSGSSMMPGETVLLTATIDPETLTRPGAWGASIVVEGGMVEARSYVDIDVIAMAPGAGFEAEPTTGMAPLTVQFTNTSTGTVTNSEWDFGDGDTGGGRDPDHVYREEGIFSVTLDITGPSGRDSVTREDYITVIAAPADDPAEDVPDASTDVDDVHDAEDDAAPPSDGITLENGCGCSLVS